MYTWRVHSKEISSYLPVSLCLSFHPSSPIWSGFFGTPTLIRNCTTLSDSSVRHSSHWKSRSCGINFISADLANCLLFIAVLHTDWTLVCLHNMIHHGLGTTKDQWSQCYISSCSNMQILRTMGMWAQAETSFACASGHWQRETTSPQQPFWPTQIAALTDRTWPWHTTILSEFVFTEGELSSQTSETHKKMLKSFAASVNLMCDSHVLIKTHWSDIRVAHQCTPKSYLLLPHAEYDVWGGKAQLHCMCGRSAMF